jgi:hypothetical protein
MEDVQELANTADVGKYLRVRKSKGFIGKIMLDGTCYSGVDQAQETNATKF